MRRLFLLALLAMPAWAGEEYDPARFQSTKGRTPFFPLNDPKTTSAAEAAWLEDDDIVLGIEVDGKARAYPARIIAFHHVVNDRVGDRAVGVTY